MSAMLARYLKDFGAVQPPAPPILSESLMEDAAAPSFSFDAFPPEPEIDIDAERAAARAEGEEAGRQEIQALREADRAEMEARHAEELAALRRQLEEAAALRVAEGYRRMAESLGVSLSNQVAEVLAPVITEALAAKAVADLAEVIRQSLGAGHAAELAVHGPADIFERLKLALGEDAPALRHQPAADLDIAVDLDDSVLVTRLSAWAASLKKVLA